MADNILKGTIKIDAPGVKEEFAKVEQGVSSLQKTFGAVPAAAKQSADGIASAFSKVTNIEVAPIKVDAQVGTIEVPKVGIPPVEIPVSANTDSAKVALDNLGNSIKPLGIKLDITEAQTKAKLLESTIETLEAKLGAKKEFIRVETDVTKIAKFNKEIQDLEKEITRLKNIGKTGFDELGNKIDAYGNQLNNLSKRSAVATQSTINLGRVIQDAPYGFIGIANNLNPLLEGFQRLKSETGSVGGAFKAFGSSLIGAGGIGIAVSLVSSLLVVFGDRLFSSGNAAKSQADKIKEAKQALDDYVESLNDINKANVKGVQNAQEELIKLQTLYKATQDANIPLAQRKKLVDELQEQYPKYFANISDEIILAGGAKKAYDDLNASIIASAKVRAGQDQLVDIQKQILVLEQQKAVSVANTAKAQLNLNKAVQNGAAIETSNLGYGTSLNLTNTNALVKAQDKVNSSKRQTVDIQKQINDLTVRANQLSGVIQKNVQLNPDSLLNPTGNLPKPKKEKEQKFDFLFDFLPFDPSGKLRPEQKSKILDAASKFQKEFEGIFKGVNDLIIGSDQQRIQKAIQFDLNLKAGKVKLDLTRLRQETDKAIKDADVIPENTIAEIDKTIVDKFTRGVQDAQETLRNKKLFGDLDFLTTDLSAAIDLFKTRVTQIGGQIPKIVEGININGKPVELKFEDLFDTTKISNADALDALKKAFDKIKNDVKAQTIDLKNAIQSALDNALINISTEGLASIGEAIGAALTGNDIGSVFEAFEQTLGSAVQALGKQIITLNVAALALKKSLKLTFANPAVGIAAGIALVAVGAAIKNLASGGIKGFNKGGDVPGIGSRDTVPAMLTPGEYVVTKDKAPLAKALLAAFGKGPSIKGFQFGGDVSFVPKITAPSIPTTSFVKYNNPVYQNMGKSSVEVHHTGELTARGDNLVYVFNKTNRKQSLTV